MSGLQGKLQITWRSGTPLHKLRAITEAIWTKIHKEQIVEGIWFHMPTKFSIMLQRIKCDHLTIFKKHRDWEVQIQTTWLLFNTQDETRNHLFFNIPFTRTLLFSQAEMLNQSFIKTQLDVLLGTYLFIKTRQVFHMYKND